MSQTLSRCVNVQLSVNLPTFECTDDILGNLGNLTDFGRGLGSIPGQLGSIVDCVASDLRAQIEAAIQTFTDTMRGILKAFNILIPDPIFGTITIPEFEFDLRLRELWTQFKLYLYQKMINILASIPGLGFILDLINVPIPFLDGVKLLDVFTPEGRARIAAAVRERWQSIADALGMPWDFTFTGELTLESVDFAIQNILNRIYSEITKMLSNVIWTALNLIPNLTEAIKKIWQTFGLPLLPAFFVPDFATFFDNLWQGVVDTFDNVVDRMKAMVDLMLDFNLKDMLRGAFGSILNLIPWPFGWTIREILKLSNVDWNLTLPEITFSRVVQAIQDLFNRIPTLIFELWLQLIKPFLDAIKSILAPITELLKYIPFTFCSFISLVASPLLGVGALVREILPEQIEIITVNPPPALSAT